MKFEPQPRVRSNEQNTSNIPTGPANPLRAHPLPGTVRPAAQRKPRPPGPDGRHRTPSRGGARRVGRIVTVSSEQYPFQRAAEIKDQRAVRDDRRPHRGRVRHSRSGGHPRRSEERKPPPLRDGPSPVPGPPPRHAPIFPRLRRRARTAGTPVAIAVARSIARISRAPSASGIDATRSWTGTKRSSSPRETARKEST